VIGQEMNKEFRNDPYQQGHSTGFAEEETLYETGHLPPDNAAKNLAKLFLSIKDSSCYFLNRSRVFRVGLNEILGSIERSGDGQQVI
jgi:hypothetical protein